MVGLAQIREFQKPNVVFRQCGDQLFAPAGVKLLDHSPDPLGDRPEGLARRQPVVAALHHIALNLLLESRDADFKEFVEVRTGDAKKLDSLQQWRRGVQRLVENALVEFQPAQFAVDKVGRPKFRHCGRHIRSQNTTVTTG